MVGIVDQMTDSLLGLNGHRNARQSVLAHVQAHNPGLSKKALTRQVAEAVIELARGLQPGTFFNCSDIVWEAFRLMKTNAALLAEDLHEIVGLLSFDSPEATCELVEMDFRPFPAPISTSRKPKVIWVLQPAHAGIPCPA